MTFRTMKTQELKEEREAEIEQLDDTAQYQKSKEQLNQFNQVKKILMNFALMLLSFRRCVLLLVLAFPLTSPSHIMALMVPLAAMLHLKRHLRVAWCRTFEESSNYCQFARNAKHYVITPPIISFATLYWCGAQPVFGSE